MTPYVSSFAGGWGDSELPIRARYSDGSYTDLTLRCDDWMDNPEETGWEGYMDQQVVPVLNDLDRLGSDRGGSLFEVSLNVDPSKELTELVLGG